MTGKAQWTVDATSETVRSMLDHESDVINHRMSWLGTFQGFLFAGLGFSWKLQENSPMLVICTLGFAVSIATLTALLGASQATKRLILWWQHHKPLDYEGPGVLGFEVRNPDSSAFYLASWNFIPLCFALAWLALFIIRVAFYPGIHRPK